MRKMGLDFALEYDILAFVVEKKDGGFGREPRQVPKEVDQTIRTLTGKDNGNLERVFSAINIATELHGAKEEDYKEFRQSLIRKGVLKPLT